MPSPVYALLNGASPFQSTYSIRTSTAGASTSSIGLSETPPARDTVEISSGSSPAGEGYTGPPSATYDPPPVSDRFRFGIQHGMLDSRLRYSALRSPFGDVANSTYAARQSLQGQVSYTAGGGGPYSALFDLQYQDSTPNPTRAASNVDARVELNRMADQSLMLLSIL